MSYHTPIDEDYIDVEHRRAEVSATEDADRSLDEYSEAESKMDWSHTYGRYPGTLAATQVDEEIDRTAPQDNDGRSQTRTGFNPYESPDPSKWQRLNQLNDGWRSPERKDQNRYADRKRYVDTFCDQLDMTPYQRDRVWEIARSIDMSRMGRYSSQQTILAIVTIVANEDRRMIRDEYMFHHLVRRTDLSMDEIRTLRQMVKRDSDVIRP